MLGLVPFWGRVKQKGHNGENPSLTTHWSSRVVSYFAANQNPAPDAKRRPPRQNPGSAVSASQMMKTPMCLSSPSECVVGMMDVLLLDAPHSTDSSGEHAAPAAMTLTEAPSFDWFRLADDTGSLGDGNAWS